MKFNKEDAGKELIRKMTLNGETLSTSERSVNEALDIFIPKFATEETEMTDFVETVLPLMTITENNLRNNNSTFAKTFESKKNAEIEELKERLEKLNKVDTKPKDESKKSTDDTSELNSKIDSILSELNILKEQRLKDESKNVIANKKELLADTLKKKGIKNEAELKSFLHIVDINNDTDIDELSNKIVEAFNIKKAAINDGSSVNNSKGSKTIDYRAAFAKLKTSKK